MRKRFISTLKILMCKPMMDYILNSLLLFEKCKSEFFEAEIWGLCREFLIEFLEKFIVFLSIARLLVNVPWWNWKGWALNTKREGKIYKEVGVTEKRAKRGDDSTTQSNETKLTCRRATRICLRNSNITSWNNSLRWGSEFTDKGKLSSVIVWHVVNSLVCCVLMGPYTICTKPTLNMSTIFV